MSKSEVKISIIIPIYNSEKYLEECIDSVLNQTYSDYEIICVDDGSTDSSLEILKKYSEISPKIKIITQKNQFAGVARNTGIENSAGHYITFLDSDDIFVPTALEKLISLAEYYDADVVRASASVLGDSKKIVDWALNKNYVKNEIPFDWHNNSQNIFCISSGNPWGMLVKREIVMKNNIRFFTTRVTEDIGFTYFAYLYSEKIVATYECVVEHRETKGGLEDSKVKYPLVPLVARHKLLDMIKEMGVYESTYRGFWYAAMNSYIQVLTKLSNSKKDIKSIKYIKKYYDSIKNIGHLHKDLIIKSKYDAPPLLTNVAEEIAEVFNSRSFSNYIIKIYSKSLKNIKKKCNLTYWHTTDKISEKISYVASKIEIKSDKGPYFSIIIPVYNAEKYISKCLNHLINQTYTNFEIICVDDESNDSSCEIIGKYISSNNNIRLVKQKNSGAGIARNKGIELSNGDYIIFIDADDWVNYNYLKCLVKAIKKNNSADMIMYSYRKYDTITKKKTKISGHYKNKMTLQKDFELLMDNNLVVPWNKIYKKSFLTNNNLTFTDLKCANDRPFYFHALSCMKEMGYINKVLINYRVNNSKSIIGLNRTINFKCHFDAFDLVSECYKNLGNAEYLKLVDLTVGDCFHFYERAPKEYKAEIEKEMCHFIDRITEGNIKELFDLWWYKKYIFLKMDRLREIPMEELEHIATKGDRDAKYRIGLIKKTSTDPIEIEYAIKMFKEAYDMGHLRAGYELSDLFLKSDSHQKYAISILEQLSDKGEKDAMFRLGRLYRDGIIIEKDEDLAKKLLRRAANLGHKRSQLELAELLSKSNNEKEVAEALIICTRLSEQGDKDAMFRLSRLSKDETLHIYWLNRAAECGHKGALTELEQYEKKHIKKDESNLFQRLRHIAESGEINSQIKIARMYRDGVGTKKDVNQSLIWYKKCHEQTKDVDLELADLIYAYKITKDFELAHQIYKKESDQGNRNASYKLYKMYQKGYIDCPETEDPIHLLEQASNSKHERAMLEYAEHIINTKEEMKYDVALNICQELSQKNNKDALFRLGLMYKNGICVTKNDDESIRLLKKSAELGHKGALKELSAIIL